VTCTPASGSTFPIGTTTVNCEATDAAGNVGTALFTVTVNPAPDTTAPDVEITGAVDRSGRAITNGGTTPMNYIRITFEATDDVGIDFIGCSLDGGEDFESCTSPVVYSGLSRGTHTVTVRATDAAGNSGEDEFTWTISNPAPSRGPPAATAGEEQPAAPPAQEPSAGGDQQEQPAAEQEERGGEAGGEEEQPAEEVQGEEQPAEEVQGEEQAGTTTEEAGGEEEQPPAAQQEEGEAEGEEGGESDNSG
jgi:hypothetical protein